MRSLVRIATSIKSSEATCFSPSASVAYSIFTLFPDFFERRREFLQGRLHRLGAQHLEFGRPGMGSGQCAHQKQGAAQQSNCAHQSSLPASFRQRRRLGIADYRPAASHAEARAETGARSVAPSIPDRSVARMVLMAAENRINPRGQPRRRIAPERSGSSQRFRCAPGFFARLPRPVGETGHQIADETLGGVARTGSETERLDGPAPPAEPSHSGRSA